MKRNIMNEAEKLIKAHRRKKRWYQAVTCLAGIVVFCTVYSLILPAITMEKYQCGIEEHTHTQECYDAEGSLICGLEEHVHTDACVRSEETAENGTEETADTTTENTGNAATSEKVETVETAETTESSETADSTETENAGSETENTESDTTQEDTETTVDTGTSETDTTTENTEDTKTDETAQDTETQEEWEATFQSVELTGKYPEDVLAIAKTQIGYTESTENYVTDEAGEDRGYTRYGQWYGEPYGEWSGMFASFCLHYAGVEGMPLSDDCEEWIKELSKEEYSLYHEVSDTEYEPVPGDMVFFDLDGDTKADHTGIISEVNISETENELKTIEGDWEDKVQTVTRSADDEKILGYGALPEQEKEEEQTEENAQAQDFELSVETESGITVTVSGSGEALPYPADEVTVKAQEVTDKSVQKLWNQVLEKEDAASGENFLLDITLWHDEEEIEPTGNVTVVFSGFDTEGYSPKIYHIDEQAEEVTDMNAVLEDSGDISVETDHFSVYAGTAVPEDSKALSGYIGNQLQSGRNFHLTGNAWTEQNGNRANLNITQDTVINLNGNILTISKSTQCFNVSNNATLTIVDSKDITDDEVESSGNQLYGNQASLVDNKLTYYITESTPNGTGTTEVLKQHTVDFRGSGKIVFGAGAVSDQVVLVSGGTLKIQGGILQNLNGKHTVCVNSGKAEMTGGLVQGKLNNSESGGGFYINSGGTLDISGGYIAGSTGSNGGGIYTKGTVHMTGGVIAANHANAGGGIYVDGGNVDISGGAVAGNRVNDGHNSGGGIYVSSGILSLSDNGYVTNNYKNVCCTKDVNNAHGGGGIALAGSSQMNMSGGYVTGNYSGLAGGGIYAGFWNESASFTMSGGTIASNCAEQGEGGGLRVAGGTNAVISVSTGKAYITNNITNTPDDWGGGGIFVQQNGNLNIMNALITENSAGGYGGGVAACPTGETLIVSTEGAAIYQNSDEGIHMSGGGNGKNEDETIAQQDPVFTNNGHSDYFCVRSKKDTPISLVTGEMVGGGAANWTGSCDGKYVEISKSGYAVANYLFGLKAEPNQSDIDEAKNVTTLIISGNRSNIHGGGIMTNGGLIIGRKENVTNSPSLDITGTKAMEVDGSAAESGLDFQFQLLDDNGNVVGTATADSFTGKFTISPDIKYSEAKTYTYYLKEVDDNRPFVTYDESQYKIDVTIAEKSVTLLGVTFTSYYVDSVKVTKIGTETPGGGEEVADTFKIHYQNSDGWNNVNLHIWGTGDLNTEWPGIEVSEDPNNEGWYTQELTVSGNGKFDYLFNDGTANNKTGDKSNSYSPGGELWVDKDGNPIAKPSDWVSETDISSNVDVTGTLNDDGSYSLTINGDAFCNTKTIAYELPETGGAGTKLYTIGGLLLIMGAGFILLYRSKKGRGGASS